MELPNQSQTNQCMRADESPCTFLEHMRDIHVENFGILQRLKLEPLPQDSPFLKRRDSAASMATDTASKKQSTTASTPLPEQGEFSEDLTNLQNLTLSYLSDFVALLHQFLVRLLLQMLHSSLRWLRRRLYRRSRLVQRFRAS